MRLKGKKLLLVLILFMAGIFFFNQADAQCSICTRTAQQMGEKPARGLNAGIMYLAVTPLLLIGIVGYNWWKKNNSNH
jgi:UPF0716 family protein affecting phage T7 exclusion